MLYARRDDTLAMKYFALHLHDAAQHEEIPGVTAFVGEDASGSFGLLAGHTRFATALVFGLARFHTDDADWRYIAMPGALLYCCDHRVVVVTRRYVIDTDYQQISATLAAELFREEQTMQSFKTSLRRMEDEMLKRLWAIDRGDGGTMR